MTSITVSDNRQHQDGCIRCYVAPHQQKYSKSLFFTKHRQTFISYNLNTT